MINPSRFSIPIAKSGLALILSIAVPNPASSFSAELLAPPGAAEASLQRELMPDTNIESVAQLLNRHIPRKNIENTEYLSVELHNLDKILMQINNLDDSQKDAAVALCDKLISSVNSSPAAKTHYGIKIQLMFVHKAKADIYFTRAKYAGAFKIYDTVVGVYNEVAKARGEILSDTKLSLVLSEVISRRDFSRALSEYYDNGNFGLAVKLLKDLIGSGPDSALQLAGIYIRHRRWDDAEKVLLDGLSIFGPQGNPRAVQNYTTEAIRETAAKFYRRLAFVYISKPGNNFDKALSCYSKVSDCAGENAEDYCNVLNLAIMRDNKSPETVRLFNAANKKFTTQNIYVKKAQALMYISMNKFDEAAALTAEIINSGQNGVSVFELFFANEKSGELIKRIFKNNQSGDFFEKFKLAAHKAMSGCEVNTQLLQGFINAVSGSIVLPAGAALKQDFDDFIAAAKVNLAQRLVVESRILGAEKNIGGAVELAQRAVKFNPANPQTNMFYRLYKVIETTGSGGFTEDLKPAVREFLKFAVETEAEFLQHSQKGVLTPNNEELLFNAVEDVYLNMLAAFYKYKTQKQEFWEVVKSVEDFALTARWPKQSVLKGTVVYALARLYILHSLNIKELVAPNEFDYLKESIKLEQSSMVNRHIKANALLKRALKYMKCYEYETAIADLSKILENKQLLDFFDAAETKSIYFYKDYAEIMLNRRSMPEPEELLKLIEPYNPKHKVEFAVNYSREYLNHGKKAEAKICLDFAEPLIEKIESEDKYFATELYNYNLAVYLFLSGDYTEALKLIESEITQRYYRVEEKTPVGRRLKLSNLVKEENFNRSLLLEQDLLEFAGMFFMASRLNKKDDKKVDDFSKHLFKLAVELTLRDINARLKALNHLKNPWNAAFAHIGDEVLIGLFEAKLNSADNNDNELVINVAKELASRVNLQFIIRYSKGAKDNLAPLRERVKKNKYLAKLLKDAESQLLPNSAARALSAKIPSNVIEDLQILTDIEDKKRFLAEYVDPQINGALKIGENITNAQLLYKIVLKAVEKYAESSGVSAEAVKPAAQSYMRNQDIEVLANELTVRQDAHKWLSCSDIGAFAKRINCKDEDVRLMVQSAVNKVIAANDRSDLVELFWKELITSRLEVLNKLLQGWYDTQEFKESINEVKKKDSFNDMLDVFVDNAYKVLLGSSEYTLAVEADKQYWNAQIIKQSRWKGFKALLDKKAKDYVSNPKTQEAVVNSQ